MSYAKTFVCILLLSACGGSSSSKDPAIPEAPVVQPNPLPSEQPKPLPIPEPKPLPSVPVLPESRPLTPAERENYLTNQDHFKVPTVAPMGLGYNTETGQWQAKPCLNQPNPIQTVIEQSFERDQFLLLPLSSARQVKELHDFEGNPLYLGGNLLDKNESVLGLVAIAKKIRKKISATEWEWDKAYRDLDPAKKLERCGNVYKKGSVYGLFMLSTLWFDTSSLENKERLLSRLIDSKLLGEFDDPAAFARNLHELSLQIAGTPLISIKGVGRQFNLDSAAAKIGFDFSAELTDWMYAAEQLDLTQVHEVGVIFEGYPP